MNNQTNHHQIVNAGRAIANAQVADRKRAIPYRPEYNAITESVVGSLFLQQVWYWWQVNGRKPFYKYLSPCNADRYREGDSWEEELGFKPGGARDAIATKITKGTNKKEAFETSLVIYWTDSNRMTWYQVNEELFFFLVGLAYEHPELLDNWGGRGYIGTQRVSAFIDNLRGATPLSSESTSKNTAEKKNNRSNLEDRPEKDPLMELLDRSGVIVSSQMQAEQWRDLLQITNDMKLIKEAFAATAAQSKRPTPAYIRAILERCLAQGVHPGEWPQKREARHKNTYQRQQTVSDLTSKEWAFLTEHPRADLSEMPT